MKVLGQVEVAEPYFKVEVAGPYRKLAFLGLNLQLQSLFVYLLAQMIKVKIRKRWNQMKKQSKEHFRSVLVFVAHFKIIQKMKILGQLLNFSYVTTLQSLYHLCSLIPSNCSSNSSYVPQSLVTIVPIAPIFPNTQSLIPIVHSPQS